MGLCLGTLPILCVPPWLARAAGAQPAHPFLRDGDMHGSPLEKGHCKVPDARRLNELILGCLLFRISSKIN